METQTLRTSKTSRVKRKRLVYKNGATRISIDDLIAPPYEEVQAEILRKVGEMPKIPDDLPKGNWTEQALKVLEERYLIKDSNLKVVETPEEMVWRVSWEIASAEARWGAKRKDVEGTAREFYKLMISRKFLPNSPTLMNAGTGNGLQYSACFVLPVEDSMEGIFDALKYQALIHKTGGGTGFAFSRLRPQGSIVKTSSGTASGPISFMRIFDAATNEVKQGGKRRGANMGILRVDHPDIMEFIHCKEEGGITNFNISVAVTDAFMDAYFKDEEYDLIDPRTKTAVGKLSARKVFDEIAKGAWKTGDPGLIFIDRINAGRANPIPSLGPIESTNPCGEQPLYPFDACNLGSIFLGYFVHKDPRTGLKAIDWDELERVSKVATRFLDNVIEVNPYPLAQIRKVVFNSRRIGLGVGGWADMLLELGIPFDSEEAITLAEKVMKFILDKSLEEDYELAEKRGAFPLFPVSIYREGRPRRNSTVTTIAPTGTISIIAGASSGIEPLFAIAYQHIVKDKHLDRKLTFLNPKFEEIAKERGFWSEELMNKVGERGVIRDIEEIPEDVRKLFGTAHEIDPIWHIKTQSAFQKYTENAVSKTINLRHDTTVDEVKKAYLMAWELNCKGITVFRDGSKDAQVLNLGTKSQNAEVSTTQEPIILERPVKVEGATYRIVTPLGSAFITVNQDPKGNPFEVFIAIGKAGSEVAAMAEALGRMISTTLRFGNHKPPIERAKEIVEQLQGIGGGRFVGFGPNKVRSLPDAVAKAISMHFGFNSANHDSTVETHELSTSQTAELENTIGDICPSCGAAALVYEEGCTKCHVCGYSEC
jgi:ribonucleoside-diphosphate reductase alpha chain